MADPDDTVELTDLEVIQQFSLAVRGAKARRADVIAALEADIAYLRGSRASASRTAPAKAAPAKPPAAKAPPKAPAAKGPVRATAKTSAKTSAKAPAKKATRARA